MFIVHCIFSVASQQELFDGAPAIVTGTGTVRSMHLSVGKCGSASLQEEKRIGYFLLCPLGTLKNAAVHLCGALGLACYG